MNDVYIHNSRVFLLKFKLSGSPHTVAGEKDSTTFEYSGIKFTIKGFWWIFHVPSIYINLIMPLTFLYNEFFFVKGFFYIVKQQHVHFKYVTDSFVYEPKKKKKNNTCLTEIRVL